MKNLILLLLLTLVVDCNALGLKDEVNILYHEGHITLSALEDILYTVNYVVGEDVEDTHHYIEEVDIALRERLNTGDIDSVAAMALYRILISYKDPLRYLVSFNTFEELRVQILDYPGYEYKYYKD